MGYKGSVAIAEQDDEARRAVLQAKGAEQRGQGNAQATMTMEITDLGAEGSRVKVSSDILVTGRVAQMGRGIMQDVATRMMGEMAQCMEATIAAARPPRRPTPTPTPGPPQRHRPPARRHRRRAAPRPPPRPRPRRRRPPRPSRRRPPAPPRRRRRRAPPRRRPAPRRRRRPRRSRAAGCSWRWCGAAPLPRGPGPEEGVGVPGFVDPHSHVVPGVDDGARSLEEGLQMVERGARTGTRLLFATPHVCPGLWLTRRRRDLVERRFAELAGGRAGRHRAASGLRGDAGPRAAALHRRPGAARPAAGPTCCWSTGRSARRGAATPTCCDLVRRAVRVGLVPLVAHPERRVGWRRRPDRELALRLREAGALLQVDASGPPAATPGPAGAEDASPDDRGGPVRRHRLRRPRRALGELAAARRVARRDRRARTDASSPTGCAAAARSGSSATSPRPRRAPRRPARAGSGRAPGGRRRPRCRRTASARG